MNLEHLDHCLLTYVFVQAFEASPALDPTAAGMSKSLPAQRSPYVPSVVDLRSIARPCNTPGPAKPSACLENTNAKIARLVAKPTPSKAPALSKPVARTLDAEFQSAGSVNDGTSLPMNSTPGPSLNVMTPIQRSNPSTPLKELWW